MVEYLLVYPENLSVIASKINKHIRKRYRYFDTQLGILYPSIYYDTAAADRTHIIILLPINIDIDIELKNYVSIFCQYALKEQ